MGIKTRAAPPQRLAQLVPYHDERRAVDRILNAARTAAGFVWLMTEDEPHGRILAVRTVTSVALWTVS
jgi:hypothetical protein